MPGPELKTGGFRRLVRHAPPAFCSTHPTARAGIETIQQHNFHRLNIAIDFFYESGK